MVEGNVTSLLVRKITVTILISIILLVPIETFALGGPPPLALFLDVNPRTQRVNAGGSTIYEVMATAEWTGWFNLSVGSTPTIEQDVLITSLPKGVEANFTDTFYIDDISSHSIPLEISISSDIEYSMINLTIVLSGIDIQNGELNNGTISTTLRVILFVVPKETSLGEASTVFYEGFDNGGGGWNFISEGGKVGLSVNSYFNRVPVNHLVLNDWSLSKSVAAEHMIPLLNDSFILEFELKSRKLNLFQIKFVLQDIMLNEVLSVEFTNRNILVQNIIYGEYEESQWYKFRFEIDSDKRTFKWYLDNQYMDILPWKGSPDKIRISTSDSWLGVGEVDNIFIQKILEIPDTTITITSTTTSTISITVSSIVTETETKTLTETTDSTILYWAIGATVIAIVFPLILILKKRRG